MLINLGLAQQIHYYQATKSVGSVSLRRVGNHCYITVINLM